MANILHFIEIEAILRLILATFNLLIHARSIRHLLPMNHLTCRSLNTTLSSNKTIFYHLSNVFTFPKLYPIILTKVSEFELSLVVILWFWVRTQSTSNNRLLRWNSNIHIDSCWGIGTFLLQLWASQNRLQCTWLFNYGIVSLARIVFNRNEVVNLVMTTLSSNTKFSVLALLQKFLLTQWLWTHVLQPVLLRLVGALSLVHLVYLLSVHHVLPI